MFFKILLLALWAPFFLIRWLRWLGIAQQKEYRFNRLSQYLLTTQGIRDLVQFWPRISDFSRTGLKRPKPTSRIALTALISTLITAVLVLISWQGAVFTFGLSLIFFLISAPVWVWLAVLPTILAFRTLVIYYTQQARGKIQEAEPTIIGITGSYGKTSTKLILSHVLSQKFSVFATQRSFNTPFSLARDIARRYQDQELMIIEFAAYKIGEISWLTKRYPPDTAVITGLTDQHLALFGSRENIIQAKSELVAALPKSEPVFINGADAGARLIARHGQAENIVPYFGGHKEIDVCDVRINQQGQLEFKFKDQLIKTQLVGKQYLAACLAAVKLGLHFSLSQKQIAQGLSSFKPPDYFVQLKKSRLGFWVVDDGGTSNPAGFEAVICLAREIKALRAKSQRTNSRRGRKMILVTSGMIDLGHKTNKIHQKLAGLAEPVFQTVFYLGEPGRKQFKQVFHKRLISDQTLIQQELKSLSKDDMVVIEGRIPLWLRKYLKLEK